MLSTLWNLLLVTAAIVVAAAFQVGALAPGDAFFAAIAIVLVFTGQQIIAREHMTFFAATHSLFTRPIAIVAASAICRISRALRSAP